MAEVDLKRMALIRLAHSVSLYRPQLEKELKAFGDKVVQELEPIVQENNLAGNCRGLKGTMGIWYEASR